MHIHPGEYYISSEDAIYTILGSCVSVVLYSDRQKIGGMNHFMLPSTSEVFPEKEYQGRYGVHAMELLINGLMKEGLSRNKLTAKVFGGGNVLNTDPTSRYHIGFKNTEFVFEYLAKMVMTASKTQENTVAEREKESIRFLITGKLTIC